MLRLRGRSSRRGGACRPKLAERPGSLAGTGGIPMNVGLLPARKANLAMPGKEGPMLPFEPIAATAVENLHSFSKWGS